MMAIAPTLIMITPILPPSGPIFGEIECLFGAGEAQEAAWVRFNEAGLPHDRPISILQTDKKEPQVLLIQFPVDGNTLSDVEFAADGTITIHAENGRHVAGEFRPLKQSHNTGRWWMEFSVPSPVNEMEVIGKCLADVRGRLERPVRLTKINTIRVDIES